MPVPSSYNDITTDKSLRDYVGWAWYDREFFASSDWKNKRIVLRIDSAHYYSMVVSNKPLVLNCQFHSASKNQRIHLVEQLIV